jgi:hypothetical protein
MLLIGYKSTFTIWSLLLMIVFFTFLRFILLTLMVKDCVVLLETDPMGIVYKDVVLLVLS